MNNWLETEPDTDEPIGFLRSDHCCPMCGGVKRPLEDVCSRCYHSETYKEKMQVLKAAPVRTGPRKVAHWPPQQVLPSRPTFRIGPRTS